MISVETSMKDHEASVLKISREMDSIDETTGVTDAVMDGFYPSGDSKPTGLYRFHLTLIANFWDRILVIRQTM